MVLAGKWSSMTLAGEGSLDGSCLQLIRALDEGDGQPSHHPHAAVAAWACVR